MVHICIYTYDIYLSLHIHIYINEVSSFFRYSSIFLTKLYRFRWCRTSESYLFLRISFILMELLLYIFKFLIWYIVLIEYQIIISLGITGINSTWCWLLNTYWEICSIFFLRLFFICIHEKYGLYCILSFNVLTGFISYLYTTS